MAAKYGHGGCMTLLANAGIDIFSMNKKKENALHLAVKKGYTNVVALLISSRFPLEKERCDRKTALHLACENPEYVKIVE